MADHTPIEWTDATWNPITGCTLVSEGCRHCYAARLAATRLQHHPSRKGLGRAAVVQAHGREFARFSHARTGRLLDGVEHNGMPA